MALLQNTSSSIERVDQIIDENWFRLDIAEARRGERKLSKKPVSLLDEATNVGFFGRIFQRFKNQQLLDRIRTFEETELRVYIAQKFVKLDGVLCDEYTRCSLLNDLLEDPERLSCDIRRPELVAKYGERMIHWLKDRLQAISHNYDEIISIAAEDFNEFRSNDPLATWYYDSPEKTCRIVENIQALAACISKKVGWSLLIEPGKITCHLTNFMTEYNRLDFLFTNSDGNLTREELDQKSFDVNHLTKARNALLPCVEFSRVKLRPLRDQHGDICWEDPRFYRSRLVQEIFTNEDVPNVASNDRSYGTSDFIHANYVEGGPLRNTFILTQAPMAATVEDFWRMVYQEKCRMIVMLCSAVAEADLGRMQHFKREFCSIYWPENAFSEQLIGNLIVRNCGVDCVKDPVFKITTLEVQRVDDVNREEVLKLEHWQFDWTSQADVCWPFRVLRRARLNPTPTVVHCVDGAGRSGALVTLEVVLMQLLSGFPWPEDPVYVAAVFVRLQRRGVISSPLLYLWIYRCLVHWCSPFVKDLSTRVWLGLSHSSVGFIKKYNDYLREHAQLPIPY